MQHEIGSEFWNLPIGKHNGLFPENTHWFISGRSALKAIIAENQFQNVALPVWCCDSIIKPFLDAKIEILFYEEELPDVDAALIMDFFGYTGHSNRENFKGIVIRDLTHSIFSKQYNDADYYFGSLRKWAGFWTGGYGWGFNNDIVFENDDQGYALLREKAMKEKNSYIIGYPDAESNILKEKHFLKIFETAENILDELHIVPGNMRDIELAQRLDVDMIRTQRRKNAQVLLNAFVQMAIFPELNDKDCPMFVPIKVKDRNGLRKFLIQKNIFCPVHWPISEYHRLNKKMTEFYQTELSLVCDQRYTEEDMNRIVVTIKEFKERGGEL